MFTHVFVGSNDLAISKAFYDATLGALGHGPGTEDPGRNRVIYATPTGVFAITTPIDGAPATAANGSTIGFAAASPAHADAWHAAGLAHGGTACEDPPGPRDGSPYYLAYLRDPAGNKLCALHMIQN